MNNRRTRRFKEKRPMFPFGQLMLPVIGVVAIGLLVIGVKLFFFSSPETPMIVAIPETSRETAVPAQPSSSYNQQPTAAKNTDTAQPVVPLAKIDPVKSSKPGQVLAVPVTEESQAAPRIIPSDGKMSAVDADKMKTDTLSAPQTEKIPVSHEQNTRSVWGVQIGAFSAKESANSVLTKAKGQGFSGEINQAQINGKVFFRVRIPSGNSRDSAAAIAQKLKEKGYPTLVVPMDR